MHGFNQGEKLVNYFCSDSDADVDIIMLQESWLTPANLYKLEKFNDRYSFYGISAMERAVSQSVIRGRPWGGCGILMKTSLTKNISYHKCSERFVILAFEKFLLINSYFPKINTDIDLCVVQSVLTKIEEAINLFPNLEIVWGGDFNINLEITSKYSDVFTRFMSTFDLLTCNTIIKCNLKYTYFHESMQHFSLVDHFLISKGLMSLLLDFKGLDLAFNLSDHIPVFIKLNLFVKKDVESHIPFVGVNSANVQKKLRWDHANL